MELEKNETCKQALYIFIQFQAISLPDLVTFKKLCGNNNTTIKQWYFI